MPRFTLLPVSAIATPGMAAGIGRGRLIEKTNVEDSISTCLTVVCPNEKPIARRLAFGRLIKKKSVTNVIYDSLHYVLLEHLRFVTLHYQTNPLNRRCHRRRRLNTQERTILK